MAPRNPTLLSLCFFSALLHICIFFLGSQIRTPSSLRRLWYIQPSLVIGNLLSASRDNEKSVLINRTNNDVSRECLDGIQLHCGGETTTMATTTTATNDDQWLSNAISEILNSPHISFPTPPSGIHLGPGPIDLFSTKFDSTFASDVKVSVDGKGVTRDELKTKLLGLQKHWNPEEVTFKDKSVGPVSCFGRYQMVCPR